MEPLGTAVLLLIAAVLLVLAALATRLSGRVGVPALLVFLMLGVAARLVFPDAPAPDALWSFRLGAAALVLILFDGGLRTPARAARTVLWPAVSLATLGVLLTAAITAAIGWLLGFSLYASVLIGAVVSSTDAAAVFLALKASHARLQERVGLTLELESGLNDPMAVFLTTTATAALLARAWPSATGVLVEGALQLSVGALGGYVGGGLARTLLARAHLPAAGLYPALTVGAAFAIFGLTTLAHGSGFLAVYVAAIRLGRGNLPYRSGLLRVHDALAWLAQLTMFLALGFTVAPDALARYAVPGAAFAFGLALVARPVAVACALAPFRYALPERIFVAFTGLRGATPIILATYPVLAGVPGLDGLFPLVFVVVLVGAVIPGATAGVLSRALALRQQAWPPSPAGLEMVSHADYDGEFVSYYVAEASAVAGARIRELPLPEEMLVTLVVRGHEILAPRGETRLAPGDHVYVFTKAADRPLADLLFGLPEE